MCAKKKIRFNCPDSCNVCSSNECTGEAPDCCMGLTNACELRIDELFFAAMHNANSDENHWNSNHEAPLEEALEAGFRAFYLDVCICKGEIVFCHGTCFWVGTQDPTEVFENVVQFLDNNPSEIVIFNFEISHGSPTPIQLWNVMKNVNGLEEKSYVHGGGNWPKLKNLLQDGKQIISLKHNGGNCLDTRYSGCTPYIQEFFKYTVGTKYHFEKISEIQNVQNSCVGERGTAYQKRFYAINNFVTNSFPGPTEDAAIVLNEKSFVEKRIADCESVMGRDANFVAVDFWQNGELPKIAKKINNDRGAAKLVELASGLNVSAAFLWSILILFFLVSYFTFVSQSSLFGIFLSIDFKLIINPK